jgi:mxaJ protein
MCSPFRSVAFLIAALTCVSCKAGAAGPPQPQPKASAAPALSTALRVCSDPNNLPFSNRRGEGFENRLAELLAGELGKPVEYTWWPQRRGFFRNTLNAHQCDVVIGAPSGLEMAQVTRPYYRSTYVFVTRATSRLRVASFDDPRLRRLRIGVHLIGDDYANTPPAHALTARHIVDNVAGYSIYGDYTQENPPERLIEAVASGAIDVAVAWGPLAGYFATREDVPLTVTPVAVERDSPFLPFAYDISMAVRRGDKPLLEQINGVLARRAADIERILDTYGVPRLRRVRSV